MTLTYPAVLDHPTMSRVYCFLHAPADPIAYKETAHPTTGIEVLSPPRGVA